ncbi:MAG: alpha/beta hydrolase [Gemmatimonadota bacterium]
MTGLSIPIHVETQGRDPRSDVPTFLLVHGYGASSFSWRTWLPSLAERGHVVVVDLKGFGAAPKPDDGAYAPADQAELLCRLIRQRGLQRITLAGHSLGGGICLLSALRLLEAHPGTLQRLVVVSGAAYAQRLPPFVWFAHHRRLGTGLMRVLGARWVVRWVLRGIVFDPSRVTRAQVEGYAEPLANRAARRALVDTALQILPTDLDAVTARYPNLRIPTLLLWGRQDPVVPLGVGQKLASDLPDAELVVLDRCGHLPAEELPGESLAALMYFLDRTEPHLSVQGEPGAKG